MGNIAKKYEALHTPRYIRYAEKYRTTLAGRCRAPGSVSPVNGLGAMPTSRKGQVRLESLTYRSVTLTLFVKWNT